MEDRFRGKDLFNDDISRWDVSSVHNMFDDAHTFNRPIGDWDVSNVTDMSFMFFYAESFNQNLTSRDKWSVRKAKCIFKDANANR